MTDPRLAFAELTAAAHGGHVLAALDGVQLAIRLVDGRPVDRDAVDGLYNTVNLASRLFAHVEIDVPDARADLGPLGAGPLSELLADLARRLRIEPAATPARRVELVWGGPPAAGGLALDASGWTYSVGPQHLPVAPAAGPPVGALAAGCIAVARLFVEVLAPLGLPALVGDDGVIANLLTYENAPAPAVEAVGAQLPAMTLAGGGSVGSSTVYAALLAGVPGGPVNLVDPDRFTARNQLRYPMLTTVPDEQKVRWLAELARRGGIVAQAHATDIQGYVNAFDAPPVIDLALVSVDTVEGRRDATELLAAVTLNIGVFGLSLHIARHGFTGDDGCAYCQYVDVWPSLSGAQQLAQVIGLPVERVVAIELGSGRLEPQDAAMLRASERFGDRPPQAGDRLADIRRRVYAQAALPTRDGDILVSAPFVSVMAGVLGLVEALKHADPTLAPFRLAGRYDLDLTGRPPGFVTRLRRDRTGRCLCYSGFRRRAYVTLHAKPRLFDRRQPSASAATSAERTF